MRRAGYDSDTCQSWTWQVVANKLAAAIKARLDGLDSKAGYRAVFHEHVLLLDPRALHISERGGCPVDTYSDCLFEALRRLG